MAEQTFRLRRNRLEAWAYGLRLWARFVVFIMLPAVIGAAASAWIPLGIDATRTAVLVGLLFGGIGGFQLWLLHRGDWIRIERDGTVREPRHEYGWSLNLAEVTDVEIHPDGRLRISWTRKYRGPTARELWLEDPQAFARAVAEQAPQIQSSAS